MLRISDNFAGPDGRWETDGNIVELPVLCRVLQPLDKILRPHSGAGIKRAMLGPSHHQLHVGAADIDDQSLFHRPPNSLRSALLAEADGLTEFLEDTFFILSAGWGGRPAFDDFERQKPEQRHARKFQIEPQIFCDLLDRAGAIELRGELGLGDGQAKILDPLKSIASVGGNGSRFVIRATAELGNCTNRRVASAH